jgi:CO/xanthine dehydrogenase FAD-binding subunit
MTVSTPHLWDAYVMAGSVREALQAVEHYGEGACLMAGGTDLILLLEQAQRAVPAVIDISQIADLREVYLDGDEVVVGAAVTFSDVLASPLFKVHAPSLRQAALTVGSIQVRNVATLVGNVVNASPAADGVPPLLTLGARVVIAGPGGAERQVPLERFLRGPRCVALEFGEMVTHLRFPAPRQPDGAIFLKVSLRRTMAIAVVNVALRLEVDGAHVLAARIALGSVAPTVVRAREAESLLTDETLSGGVIAQAGQAAQRAAHPIDDFRASAAYRLRVVDTLVQRGLRSLAGLPP